MGTKGTQGEHRFVVDVDDFTADLLKVIVAKSGFYHVEFEADGGDKVGVNILYFGKADGDGDKAGEGGESIGD